MPSCKDYRAVFVCLGLGALPVGRLAYGAEVTDIPDAKGAFLSLGYSGSAYQGTIEEDGIGIGKRKEIHHDLHVDVSYGLTRGFALEASLQYAPATLFTFPGVRPMRFDPATLQGTYLVGEAPSEPLSYRMSGLRGIRVGFELQPSQWSTSASSSSTVWLLGAAFQMPSADDNLWTYKNGRRGAGPGNFVTHLRASLSKRRGPVDAYMRVATALGAPLTLDIVDENDAVLAREATLQPPRSVAARTGLEVEFWATPEETRATFNVAISTRYLSWGDIGSGIYLPEVLPSSKGIATTRSESIQVGGHLGGHLYETSGWTLHAMGGLFWETPYRPEHVYTNVRMTTENLRATWLLTVEHRFASRKSAMDDVDAP